MLRLLGSSALRVGARGSRAVTIGRMERLESARLEAIKSVRLLACSELPAEVKLSKGLELLGKMQYPRRFVEYIISNRVTTDGITSIFPLIADVYLSERHQGVVKVVPITFESDEAMNLFGTDRLVKVSALMSDAVIRWHSNSKNPEAVVAGFLRELSLLPDKNSASILAIGLPDHLMSVLEKKDPYDPNVLQINFACQLVAKWLQRADHARTCTLTTEFLESMCQFFTSCNVHAVASVLLHHVGPGRLERPQLSEDVAQAVQCFTANYPHLPGAEKSLPKVEFASPDARMRFVLSRFCERLAKSDALEASEQGGKTYLARSCTAGVIHHNSRVFALHKGFLRRFVYPTITMPTEDSTYMRTKFLRGLCNLGHYRIAIDIAVDLSHLHPGMYFGNEALHSILIRACAAMDSLIARDTMAIMEREGQQCESRPTRKVMITGVNKNVVTVMSSGLFVGLSKMGEESAARTKCLMLIVRKLRKIAAEILQKNPRAFDWMTVLRLARIALWTKDWEMADISVRFAIGLGVVRPQWAENWSADRSADMENISSLFREEVVFDPNAQLQGQPSVLEQTMSDLHDEVWMDLDPLKYDQMTKIMALAVQTAAAARKPLLALHTVYLMLDHEVSPDEDTLRLMLKLLSEAACYDSTISFFKEKAAKPNVFKSSELALYLVEALAMIGRIDDARQVLEVLKPKLLRLSQTSEEKSPQGAARKRWQALCKPLLERCILLLQSALQQCKEFEDLSKVQMTNEQAMNTVIYLLELLYSVPSELGPVVVLPKSVLTVLATFFRKGSPEVVDIFERRLIIRVQTGADIVSAVREYEALSTKSTAVAI